MNFDPLTHPGFTYEERTTAQLKVCVEALQEIAGLVNKTLLSTEEMTYSDGAHNAFCEAADMAQQALRKINGITHNI